MIGLRSGAAPGRGRFAAPRHRPRIALALILVVAFMVVLDFSIVNVALASIERELHVGATDVQWVITGYAITFGGLLVLGGRIGDLFGRRRMLVTGLVVFSLASLAGGLATGIVELVAARAVQGIGAAIVAPASLSLITTTTPEGAPRNRAIGMYGATASIGFVAGLVLGGVLVQFLDWRSVLWVNVPIGLAAAAAAPLLLGESRSSRPVRLDVMGGLLVTGSIAALVYGVSLGPVDGWLADSTVIALVASVALAWAFVTWERRHPEPLVRLGILRTRTLRAANAFTVAVGAWSAGELLVLPLFLQLALHESALVTGLAMAPQGLVAFVASSKGPAIVRHIGTTRALVLAAGSAATGFALLALFMGTRSDPLLFAGLVLAGFGTATAMFVATVLATGGVHDHEQGLASGLVNMSRQVGAAVGVALAAAVIGTTASAGSSVRGDAIAIGVVSLIALTAGVAIRHGLSPARARSNDEREDDDALPVHREHGTGAVRGPAQRTAPIESVAACRDCRIER